MPVLVIVRVFGFSLSWKVESRGHDKIDLQTEDVLISSRTATVLRNPELYQLAHQGGRQGFVCRKPDCALAGIVVLKFVLQVSLPFVLAGSTENKLSARLIRVSSTSERRNGRSALAATYRTSALMRIGVSKVQTV